jgi:hypothetical protein
LGVTSDGSAFFSVLRSAKVRGASFALFFAAIASSCILNPQPEPPDDGTPSSRGGVAGTGQGGKGGVGGAISVDAAGGSGQGGSGQGGSGGQGVGGSAGSAAGTAGTGFGGSGGGSGAGGTGGVAGSAGDAGTAGVGGSGGAGGGTGGVAGTGGAGGTGGGPSGPCRGSQDCPTGTACYADRGACDVVPPADCVFPPPEGGTRQRFATCSAATPCAAGLTCVTSARVLGPTGNYEPAGTGMCLGACNPCIPGSCGTGETCFARDDASGGFCVGALLTEGTPCGSAQARSVCAAGLTCAELTAFAGRTCLPHCRPDASAPNPGTHEGHSATISADCAAGDVCFESASSSMSSTPTDFACVAGSLVGSGAFCAGNQYCRPPAACTIGVCLP